MSAALFYSNEVKRRVAEVIADVESKTSAELVVAVRKSSGRYRETDYLVGVAMALVGVLVFLFAPTPFRVDVFPIELAAVFVLGVLGSANLPPLRRWLTRRAVRDGNVRTASRAALAELGITRTRSRAGVLVFASIFERRVEVVADVGLDGIEGVPVWRAACDDLGAAVGAADVERFITGLRALGPILAERLPRAHDDVNELPDRMDAG